MFGAGVRTPALILRILLVIALLSWGSIAWGVLEMRAAGRADSRSAGLKIGLAIRDHYRRIRAGETVANPNFHRNRVRVGLIGAALFLMIAAIGFALLEGDADFGPVPSAAAPMLVLGGIAGVAALLLALVAWRLGHRRRLPS